MLSMVVLPEPLGPINAVTLPASAVRVAALSAWLPPNALDTPSTTNRAPLIGASSGVPPLFSFAVTTPRPALRSSFETIARPTLVKPPERSHTADDQEAAVEDQRILLERRRLVGTELHDRGTDHGAVHTCRTAEDRRRQNCCGKGEPEGFRRDEQVGVGEQRTRQTGGGTHRWHNRAASSGTPIHPATTPEPATA